MHSSALNSCELTLPCIKFSLTKIDDSAISHFLVSRYLKILTERALRFKFWVFLLMHGVFTLGRDVFSARLMPYLR
jgi:hypothetical protein